MPLPLEKVPDNDWDGTRRNFETIEREWDHHPPSARVYHDAAQTTTTAVFLAVVFNTLRWDTGGFYNASTNTRLTAYQTGLHEIGTCIRWAANATGIRLVNLRLNGSTTIAECGFQAPPATDLARNITTTQYRLTAGDYVEVLAFQRSGGNLDIQSVGNSSPEFWICYLGGY